MRLNKFMAQAGISSRRKCDDIITSGRVKINAKVVKKLGTVVDEHKDIVTIDNKPVRVKGNFIYLMLNKPAGYITTMSDPQHRPTVMELLPKLAQRIYPVGRLDYNTKGLLLFTNNGQISQKLIHPSFECDKTYLATIHGVLTNENISKLRTGVKLKEFTTSPAKVEVFAQKDGYTTYSVTIHEGKKRQVRRMFDAVGCKVSELKRVEFAGLKLGNLKEGQVRELTDKEIAYLYSL